MPWAAPVDNSVRPLLSCRDLTFRYGPQAQPVFSHLSLRIYPGEVVLVMGPSGCGKSTLAYCMAGLYPEYAGALEGEVLLEGHPLTDWGPARRARAVSILFQNPDNQFCMGRVDHELLFALENINYQGDLQARMEELLALVGLLEVSTAPIHTLSGGTKQKLALATALATGAQLLILDEPFANLDPASCAELSAMLEKLNHQGLTLVVVDHRPNWWRNFLTRVVLMEEEGDLDAGSFPPSELEAHREEFSRRGLFLDDVWLQERRPAPPSGQDQPMAEAIDLALYHKKQLFLEHLSFRLDEGSITALIGPNGTGKTTLLTALAGVGRCRGTLKMAGRAGLVFQNPRFQFLTLSVEEEVLTTLRAAQPSSSTDELAQAANALLEEFGLLAWRKHSPYELSQGQQRRLALLSMLAGDRPLLLLDEPTYAQDERATRFILELLERRVAQGLTVVLATHDLPLARACAHQILLLEGGQLTSLSSAQLVDYAQKRGVAL